MVEVEVDVVVGDEGLRVRRAARDRGRKRFARMDV